MFRSHSQRAAQVVQAKPTYLPGDILVLWDGFNHRFLTIYGAAPVNASDTDVLEVRFTTVDCMIIMEGVGGGYNTTLSYME